MSKVSVVYWSQSGNTQAMAEAVAAGITEAGKEAEVVYVSDVNVADLTAEKAFALGCPAMGAEVLEEGEFEPFMESIDGSISGKTIALFGSYGWGDGQWMREWAERVTGEGATVVNGEGLICQETPDDAMIEEISRRSDSVSLLPQARSCVQNDSTSSSGCAAHRLMSTPGSQCGQALSCGDNDCIVFPLFLSG